MVHSCCIKNCRSEWKISEGVTFHNFPLKVEFHEKFVAAIPPNLLPKVSKYSKICSKHFTTDSFQPVTSTSVRRILKRNAIPTLFSFHSDCTPTNKALNYGPSTSNINVEFDEEKPPNDNSSQSTMEQCSSVGKRDVGVQTMLQEECSRIDKKDVGVQLTDKCLPPSQTVLQLRHKITILQKRLLRRDARWNAMTDVIRNLQQDSTSTQSVEEALQNRFTGFSLDMLKNEIRNSSIPKNRKRYSEEIKRFALILYSYSPKAYHFVRRKLNLPHDSMLRK